MGTLLAHLVLAAAILSAGGVAPFAGPPPAGIQVVEQRVESHFPDDLTFVLQARATEGEIVQATLTLWVGWEETSTLVPAEPFEAGPEVELTAVWNTRSQTVPPFIEITYHWSLTLSSGETVTTDPVRTEYTDSTHDWKRLESDHVILFWYDRPDDFGQALFEAAEEAYDHVARITGTTTERPVRVVIYNNQRDFCVFYAPRTCQEWIGGQTFSGITVQWGTDIDRFTFDVVPHELAHVFYSEVFKDTWIAIPTWFNEGIAVYNERTDHAEEMAMVREAAEQGRLKSLAVMTRGGGVAHGEVGLWYAIAYSLVAYIAETYGEETLGELILTLADNVPFDEALEQTTGMDMADLEVGWREWIGYPIEAAPTPIALPTMATTPFSLPTAPRGQPAPTATPEGTTSPEPPRTPEPTPTPAGPCPLGLAPAAAGLVAWAVARRKQQEESQR